MTIVTNQSRATACGNVETARAIAQSPSTQTYKKPRVEISKEVSTRGFQELLNTQSSF
ncbi:MAG TPA: hypothetical protein V6C84_01250 [Coleofasciculaceae cyanobacterium]